LAAKSFSAFERMNHPPQINANTNTASWSICSPAVLRQTDGPKGRPIAPPAGADDPGSARRGQFLLQRDNDCDTKVRIIVP